jgi:hypothetical protein
LLFSCLSFPAERKINWKARKSGDHQGCQILRCTIYQNERKYTKWPYDTPTGRKIFQKTLNYTTQPFKGRTKYAKIGIFWSENIPSGNPGGRPFWLLFKLVSLSPQLYRFLGHCHLPVSRLTVARTGWPDWVI